MKKTKIYLDMGGLSIAAWFLIVLAGCLAVFGIIFLKNFIF